MLLGLVAWTISAAFIFLISIAIQRQLRTDRRSLNLLAFILVMIFSITAYMLVVGLLGGLRPLPILLSSAAGVGLICMSGGGRRAIAELREQSSDGPRMLADWWSGLPNWLRWLTGVALALSVLRFAFLIWALPPFVWDSLSYHLTNVAHWIQVGRIETFAIPVTRIYNPANYEVLASWFAVFLQHDVVIEAAGLPPYVLAAIAVYAAARGMNASPASSLIAAIAYASTPAVILAATGTKNDIHIAAYYLVVLALIIDLANRTPSEKWPSSRNQLIVMALAIMLAIGTKTYIVHLIPGLGVMVLGAGSRSRLRAHWERAVHSLATMAGNVRMMLPILLLTGLLLAGFWNLRNWFATGNPFYPYEVLIAGRTVFDGPESEFRFDVSELAANLENLAQKFGDWRDPIRPDLPNTTGWGWFAYVVGLPALVWTMLRRPSYRWLVLGFVVSLLTLMLSTGPSPWNMRFAIWFPAVFSLCFAGMVDALPRRLPSIPAAFLVALLVAVLALNFVGTLNYNRVSADEFQAMLHLPVWQRDAARFPDNMPEPYLNANQVVPPRAVLGFNTTGNGFVYPLYRANFVQPIVYVPFSLSDSCEAIAAGMAQRHTRYLMVAPEHTEDEKIAVLDDCAKQGEVIRENGKGLYVIDD